MVLAERPQQRGCVPGVAHHGLGVAQERPVDVVLQERGIDVQDPDLAVDQAHDADDRAAVVLGQPRLTGPDAVPQPDAIVERRHVRLVDEAVVLGAPGADLQLSDGVDVTRGDRADRHRTCPTCGRPRATAASTSSTWRPRATALTSSNVPHVWATACDRSVRRHDARVLR